MIPNPSQSALIVIIFGFSNQNGETSGGVSRKVTEFVVEISPFNKNITEEECKDIVEKLSRLKCSNFNDTLSPIITMISGGLQIEFKIDGE